LQLHNGMRTALEHRETALMYQPIVSATTGELVGAEALLRWHSASLGGVSPAEFVPLAEDTGYIVALGEWVLASACAQLTRWDATAPKRLPVLSVNVSTRQLERVHVPEWVKRVLLETGLEPHRLDLEVTESALMASETGVATLEQLHQAGVFLSIDDFGTGYSSLAYLKRLPVHKLKIDQAFVRGIGIEPQDESIIRTVVAMAHNLNLRVVAEGVETQAQAQFLAQAGCDALQGYLFARPLTPDEFARQWLS
jgi:diguanylate cyclase